MRSPSSSIIFILLLLISSCTGNQEVLLEENEEELPEANDNKKVILAEVHESDFTYGVFEKDIKLYDEKGVLRSSKSYIEGDHYYSTEWIYNDKQLLVAVNGYLLNGLLNDFFKIKYDTENRVIETFRSEENGDHLTLDKFTYNDENQIQGITDYNGTISEKLFYLNEEGLIFKESIEKYFVELEFNQELNLISKQTSYEPGNEDTTSYSYSDTILPDDLIENTTSVSFKIKNNNEVLLRNYLDVFAGGSSNKLLIEEKNSIYAKQFNYEFDDENFPTKLIMNTNGKLIKEIEYFYSKQ